jgi:putative transposase
MDASLPYGEPERETAYFMQSVHRDQPAARCFVRRVIGTNGVADRIVINKSVANLAGLEVEKAILKFTSLGKAIVSVDQLPQQYPRTGSFLYRANFRAHAGLQSVPFRIRTLEGTQTAHMIRKRQFDNYGFTAFQTFVLLEACLCPK